MRFGRPFVVQVTSAMTPSSLGIKPTMRFSPQDIMPIGVSKVIMRPFGSERVSVAFLTACTAWFAAGNS